MLINLKFVNIRSIYELICKMLIEEYHYKILKLLEINAEISQRELATKFGMSLAKAYFCLNFLITKDLIKAPNFRYSQIKLAYLYLLNPSGLKEKASFIVRFLRFKIQEYHILRAKIDEITCDVE